MNVANTTVHVDRKSSTVLVLFGAVNKRRADTSPPRRQHQGKTKTKTLVRDNTRRDGDSKSHKEKEKKNEHTRLNLDGLFFTAARANNKNMYTKYAPNEHLKSQEQIIAPNAAISPCPFPPRPPPCLISLYLLLPTNPSGVRTSISLAVAFSNRGCVVLLHATRHGRGVECKTHTQTQTHTHTHTHTHTFVTHKQKLRGVSA